MGKATFYPIGNADTCLLQLNNGMVFFFDYADMHDPEEKDDKRIPLAKNFKEDLGWPKRDYVDVGAFTHGDIDHLKGAPEIFWLEHAAKYQGAGRIKINEMWVPAALIVEEGSEDETKTIRAEARYRFLRKKGIRVFSRPEHLKDWLEEQGKNPADYTDLIVDAGKTVPGFTLEGQGIEFFVHSPFAKATDEGLFDPQRRLPGAAGDHPGGRRRYQIPPHRRLHMGPLDQYRGHHPRPQERPPAGLGYPQDPPPL